MKKYLKDLETELKKLNFTKEEIEEIIADHMEMLEEAVAEGITDEEIALKFGDPDKLAKELKEVVSSESVEPKVEPVLGVGALKGYELMKSFSTLGELRNVNISLISEDVMYFPYDGDSIEVYVKGNYKEEDYNLSYNQGTFDLIRSKSKRVFSFTVNRKTPDFGVRVPLSELEKFSINLVSGDGEIEDVTAENVSIKTVSGDVECKNINTPNNLRVSVVSGDFDLKGCSAKGLVISQVSGDVELRNAKFDDDISVNTVSGDVDAKDVEANLIHFDTVSGDFEGKNVYCNEVVLKSVSGDFELENDDKSRKPEIKKKKSLSGKVTIK